MKQRTKIVKKTTFGRSYRRYNRETFIRLMSDLDWDNYFEVIDPLGTLCPIKPLTVVDTKPRWLSNALILQMREKDKAFKKARRTQLQVDWERAKQIRNELSTNINSAKSNFIRTELENNKNNPRKFWKQINELLPNMKNAEVLELQDMLTSETFSGEKLNDHINNYFANIGQTLAARCTPGLTYRQIAYGNLLRNFN